MHRIESSRHHRTSPPPPPGHALLIHTPVAGLQFHEFQLAAFPLDLGQRLRVVREPDNPYDARAIALYAGDRRIGYVPRRLNKMPARLLDAGWPLIARIEHLITGYRDRGPAHTRPSPFAYPREMKIVIALFIPLHDQGRS
ncbi:hypothetical protein FRC98_12955 [Lujinxingia vulgaris]|uniref:HIRAN domain-containing protein n=1 Tax=Lujinxingia vulgaris TaxID=2600176 RepID=A0A5C6XD70_9DELT|nr:HIRAN domain-containing protein [Lujinxingia vulgaris]TXD36729.1 hypothetical protein FRC98_12955 [Lujinxingia vulgaris]